MPSKVPKKVAYYWGFTYGCCVLLCLLYHCLTRAGRVPLLFPGDQYLATVNYCPPVEGLLAAMEASRETRRRVVSNCERGGFGLFEVTQPP